MRPQSGIPQPVMPQPGIPRSTGRRTATVLPWIVFLALIPTVLPSFLVGCGPTPDTPSAEAVPGVIRTGERVHTVRAGETLSSIARDYGTSVGALQRLNPQFDADRLPIGGELRIPPREARGAADRVRHLDRTLRLRHGRSARSPRT